MFAAVDGMGRLDLWNLNNDTEVCVCVCILIGYFSLCVCGCLGSSGGSAAGASAPTTHPNTPPTSSPTAQTAAKPLPCRGQDARSLQIPRWAFPRSARFKSHLVTSPHLGPRPAASIPAATVRCAGDHRPGTPTLSFRLEMEIIKGSSENIYSPKTVASL